MEQKTRYPITPFLLGNVKWGFSYKEIKDILICESYHKLNPNIHLWISKA
jgi:hypothetical protein